MKPTTPHDPLDDLIAAALHGDLTPEERTQFESRLQNDPAAQAAYQEAQAMHDLLEQTNRTAQPDPDFEQRMVSGIRRKIANPPHNETAWESLVILWRAVTGISAPAVRVLRGHSIWTYGGVFSAVLVVGLLFIIHQGNQVKSVFSTITSQLAVASSDGVSDKKRFALQNEIDDLRSKDVADYMPSSPPRSVNLPSARMNHITVYGQNSFAGGATFRNGYPTHAAADAPMGGAFRAMPSGAPTQVTNGSTVSVASLDSDNGAPVAKALESSVVDSSAAASQALPMDSQPPAPQAPAAPSTTSDASSSAQDLLASNNVSKLSQKQLEFQSKAVSAMPAPPSTAPASSAAPVDTRKLIRNAQLDLEVKSYQSAIDQVSALTKSAGGYVDTSNSQRGGNGKLQGTVVVKILPENLDAFLLKLRDLGEVQNQSVSTDDVTKDYYDTQARLVNSQKMELQLQDLLKRENSKVSDLLAVERELGRVRGEIEQMQGQLKLYDFQVQYATVTMNIAEKDLNQTAAYLLKEQDNFALFATDVEGAFQKARAAADQYNAQVLAANLEHVVNSDNNQVAASLVVMVAPDQIDAFLAQVRGLGRVANFTRQTQRVAKDGGDSSQPADATKTEKDKVRVQVSIRSDDDSRKQVALTVVTKQVDAALDQAKVAALANAGTEILNSSLNSTPEGASTGQLSVRVPGKEYATLMDAFRALGRQASITVQRNDNAGPGASGDDVPVIVTLALTDNDAPVQETNLVIAADDVDTQAQQIKKQAGDAGVEIKSSSFQRQPDGTEQALMTLRLPLGHYPAFLSSLQKAGKTESLSVQRDDRPDQARPDESAPAEIQLQLHNVPAIVPDNTGLWVTLRDTFGQGFGALFGSIRVIGVITAFLVPWVITLVVLAWIGRRIYVWRKNR